MDNGTGLSASDVALLNGGGFGGGLEGIIYLAIIAFMFGGGFGFGGNNGIEAVQADVNRGFDNQNLQAQTRDILSAVNAGTASATLTDAKIVVTKIC